MADLRIRPADDPPSLLVLVLDVDVASWLPPQGAPPTPDAARASDACAALQAAVSQFLVFLNTFLLLHDANRVVVLVFSRAGSVVAYPRPLESADADAAAAAAAAEDDLFDPRGGAAQDRDSVLRALRDGLAQAVAESLSQQTLQENLRQPVRVSPSLATALCIVNRRRMLKLDRPGVPAQAKQGAAAGSASLQAGSKRAATCGQARILVALKSSDVPEQYVPTMNAIFAAQRMGVPIDTCLLLEGGDSTYFQQAAHLTSGVYLRPPGYEPADEDALLQSLMTVFLADSHSRDFLSMPAQDKVDFRASCFATRTVIQEGYTCSVCLSTFDLSVGKKAYSCPTCKARFTASAPRPPALRRSGMAGVGDRT
jgi:transcription initiation factor TFIIH subunit 3